MRHSNHIHTDLVNKQKAIISYIKSTTLKGSEERIVAVANASKLYGNGIIQAWELLPKAYQKKTRHSLGCA